MLNLSITKLHFPGNQNLPAPITVSLYYKEYYTADFTLIDTGVNVNIDGTINESPLPTVSIDPTLSYVLKAVNEMCGSVYEQNLFINAYCPPNFSLSEDHSYCYIITEEDAIPPSAGENSVAATNDVYSSCGSYIVDSGYNVDGTGSSTQISLANSYWRNGSILCGNNTLVDGPMNRGGLWSTSQLTGQTVGFAICINIPTTKTYYIGLGCDNFSTIKLDGEIIVEQSTSALDTQYSVFGACFKVWFIYPLEIQAGSHYLECIGNNVSGAASFACAIYDNTPVEIAAATSDAGLNFIFNSADYIGMPIVLGSDGIGYSCSGGGTLNVCSSPINCVTITKVPVLY